jgi:hypothetical protein
VLKHVQCEYFKREEVTTISKINKKQEKNGRKAEAKKLME